MLIYKLSVSILIMAGIKYIFNPSIKKAFCNKMITHDGSEHLYEHHPENGAGFV